MAGQTDMAVADLEYMYVYSSWDLPSLLLPVTNIFSSYKVIISSFYPMGSGYKKINLWAHQQYQIICICVQY